MTIESSPLCAHGYAQGRVQGVSFRAFTRDAAVARQVCGWARNLDDGRVEFLLCGAHPAVLEVLQQLRRGPPQARVDALDWQAHPWQTVDGFTIG